MLEELTRVLQLMASIAEDFDRSHKLLSPEAGVERDKDLDDLNWARFGVFNCYRTHLGYLCSYWICV